MYGLQNIYTHPSGLGDLGWLSLLAQGIITLGGAAIGYFTAHETSEAEQARLKTEQTKIVQKQAADKQKQDWIFWAGVGLATVMLLKRKE